MQFEGGEIQGFTYGDFSPLDLSGVALWIRATDKVILSRGNSVTGIRDISPYGRDLIGNGVQCFLVNAEYGPALQGRSSGTPLGMANTTGFHSFLYDGTAYTFIVIANSLNGSGTANTIYAGGVTTAANPAFTFRPLTGSRWDRYITNAAGTAIAGYAGTGGNALPAGNIVFADINYGYGNDPAPIRTFVNGVLKQTQAFTQAPAAATTGNFVLNHRSGHLTYEILIYNNAGKSKAQIDLEFQQLTNNYILKRYPNIY